MKSIIDKWKHFGKYFGYPKCCIHSFCFEVTTRSQRKSGNKSGFIPCKYHSKLVLSKKIKLESLMRK